MSLYENHERLSQSSISPPKSVGKMYAHVGGQTPLSPPLLISGYLL